jgi:flagellar biosynthetic protein FliR
MEFIPSLDRLLVFLAVLARLGGTMAPLSSLGGHAINRRQRVAASVIFSIIVTPFSERYATEFVLEPDFLTAMMFRELMLGLTLGLCIRLLLLCFQIAGNLIAQMAGWQLGVGPSDASGGMPLSRLFDLLSVALLFAVGGHRLIMSALLDGFERFPIGQPLSAERLTTVVTDVLSQTFQLGWRIASPVVGVLVLAGIIAGLMQRTMPRLGAMASTVGWVPLVVTATLLISIGGMASCVDQPWDQELGKVFAALRGEQELVSALETP